VPRILHLGLGAFHRAHQAVYLQRLHDAGDTEWTLASGNIRPDAPELVAALQRTRGAYTLELASPDGSRDYQRITAISVVVPWEPDWASFVRIGADADTRIISFTVTEAGYEARGGEAPLLFQVLARILHARESSGAGPVTLLCCDNLRHNGDRTRAGLVAHLRATHPALAPWVEQNTRSPNTMVDRITPRPEPAVRERVRAATGVDDPAALMAESYLQWVIQDDFIAGRPAWERVGAELVADVTPYEEAKIRLLNATHSCLAWAGTLAGHSFVHEDAADPHVRQFALDYATRDAIPALQPSPLDLPAYCDSVLDRFRNAALADTNERIFTDSFAKTAAFVAPTVSDRLARSEPIEAVAVLPALYLACLRRFANGQLPYAYSDQALGAADAMAIACSADPVLTLARDSRLWGTCAGDARLVDALRRADVRTASWVGALP